MHLTLSQWTPPTPFLCLLRASLSASQAQTLPGESAGKHSGGCSPATQVRAGHFVTTPWGDLQNLPSDSPKRQSGPQIRCWGKTLQSFPNLGAQCIPRSSRPALCLPAEASKVLPRFKY